MTKLKYQLNTQMYKENLILDNAYFHRHVNITTDFFYTSRMCAPYKCKFEI